MSFLDSLIPASGPEREAALAAVAEIRANTSPCDCDRCCTTCPHDPDCPALTGDDMPELQEECASCGAQPGEYCAPDCENGLTDPNA